ncbi:MAG TPA: CopG family transcriptional regulator [Candidatus Nanoarchaeia archaeon]|nr:CopG family transcriptional regulator [Candidatus Nanoarchaeia archaeon]
MGTKEIGSAKIHVKFTREQLGIISNLKGILGGTNAEVVRTICMAYLSEKNFLSKKRGAP